MNRQPYISLLGMKMTRQTANNFRWDFAASVLFSFFNVVFNQFYVPIAIRHGATDFHVGLLTAAPAIGLLFSPIWAGMSERGDPKPYFVYPNFVGRLLIIIPALIASPWVFVSIALGYQLFMGIQAPAYASLLSRIYPPDLRGRLMGYTRMAMGALMIPLAYVIGQWIDAVGSGPALITGAVTGVLSILVFSFISSNRAGDADRKVKKRMTFKEHLELIKGNRTLLFFLAATTLSGFSNMLAVPLYSIIQVDHLKLSNVEIGYIRMAYFACLLAAYWILGSVIDRYSPKWAMCCGFLAFVIVPVLYGAVGTYPAILIAGGLQGMADASWEIGVLACVFRIAPGKEGLVFSLHLMLFGIRGTIGPLLSTSLSNTVPFSSILLCSAGLSLIGFLLFVRKYHSLPNEEGLV